MGPVLASWMDPSVKRDGLELPGVWLLDVAICRGNIPWRGGGEWNLSLSLGALDFICIS